MAAIDEVTTVLRDLEPDLGRHTADGVEAMQLAARIRTLRQLLARAGDRWIDLPHAQRLLALRSTSQVTYWIRLELLRSCMMAGGRELVSLDSVLAERLAREELGAFGGEDMTEEELEEMYRARPGSVPWERDQDTASS